MNNIIAIEKLYSMNYGVANMMKKIENNSEVTK